MYSEGHIESTFETPAEGNYEVTVSMMGSECEGEFPQWTILANDQFVAQGYSSAEWTNYSADLSLNAGNLSRDWK